MYFQEQNRVLERTRRTIIDIIRAKIFEQNINDNLWPEIILAISQVKNIRSISALKRDNLYQVLHNSPLNVNHLRVLGSTVYVFIHKEKQNLKLEKFEVRVLKSIFVKYNGHTIHKVFI